MAAAAALAAGALTGSIAVTPAAAAPAWLATTPLISATPEATDPRVAVDAQGNATALWLRKEGANRVLQTATRPAGGAWSTPVDLTDPDEDASAPRLVVDRDGNATAIWQIDTGSYLLQAASRPAGGAWSSPVTLSAPGEDAERADIAVDARGNVTAVWRRFTGSAWVVRTASRSPGKAWEGFADISGPDANIPAVALDGDGNATAVWTEYNGTKNVVHAATRSADGTWSAPDALSDPTGDASETRVVADARGDAIALWKIYDGTHTRVQAARRPAGQAWSAPHDVSEPNEASSPQIALDAEGNATAVWSEAGAGGSQIVQAASLPAGGTWSTPAVVSASGGSSFGAQIATDPDGNAVAIWQRGDDSSTAIVQAARRPRGGAWSTPVDVSGPGAIEPRIAADPQGHAVAIWRRVEDGGSQVIETAVLDAAGPRLDGFTVPASGVAGAPVSVSVSPLDVWSALGATTWSFGDGATATGASATHAYAAPGTYQVSVTGSDAVDNTTTAAATIVIAAAPSTPTETPRPTPTPTPTPTLTPTPTPTPKRPRVGRAYALRTIRVDSKGRVHLTLRCRGAGPCAGTARLTLRQRVKARGRTRTRTIVLGTARFTIAKGKTRTVRIPLTSTAKRLVTRRGRSLAIRLTGTSLQARTVVLRARTR